MELSTTILLSAGFLLLLTQGTLTDEDPATLPIRLSVVNDLSNLTPESYSTSVLKGSVLLGALNRLRKIQPDFTFKVVVDPNYGLFLERVNGVAGNKLKHTYWEILSESSGEYTKLDVGIGCYQPKENEHIVLRYSTWTKQ